jgi:outer membrane autotransporter protein
MTAGSIEGAGTYFLGSKALTVGLNNLSTTVSGTISDGGFFGGTGGSLIKVGAGTLTLTGANTYSGGTSLNGGVLAVNNVGNLGTGGLSFNGGALEALVAGSGITWTKGITLNAGGGRFLSDAGTASNLTGVIGGVSALTKDGAGELTLTANNTYTGGTTIVAGTLQLGNPNAMGSIVGDVLNGIGNQPTMFKIVNANTTGITTITNNRFSGPQAVTQFLNSSSASHATIVNNGQGVTDFFGFSTAANATIVNSEDGTTTFHDTSTAGNATIMNNSLNAQGVTQFLNSSSASQAAIVNNGQGVTDFSGFSTAANATIVSNQGGTTTFHDTSTAGNATVTTNSDSATRFNDTSTGGQARFITNAGGTVDISGLSSTGMTAGSIEGAGAYLLGSKALTVGLNNLSTTVDGTISDGGFSGGTSGSLIKVGTGTLTLTGTNTYSGGTTIENGTLMVGSPQALGAGNVTVKGGALTTDPGAITVASNYAQTGGTLLLHVAGANPGQYDSLNVGGHATLGGTLQLVALNGFKLGTTQQLTLVTAQGGIQGQFSTFINPFARNGPLQPGLVYGPNSVILEFLKTSFVPFALTRSQRRVAANLDEVVAEQSPAPIRPESSPRDKATAALIDFLFREPATNLPEDFDRIVGTDLSSLYEMSFSGANIQRFNLTERMAEIRQGATGFSSSLSANRQQLPLGKGTVEEKSVVQPSPENRWGGFVSGNGDFVSVEGDENGHGYDFTTAGVTLGVDYRITKTLAIGLMGGYARTWADLARDGRVTVNTGKGGLYATWWDRGFYINGFVGGGYDSYDTRRGALQGFANGSTDGTEFDTFADVGYDAKIGNWSLGPYVTLAYTSTNLDGYSEHGSLAPLHFVSQHEQSLRTDLGFRAEYRIKAWGVELRPSVRAAWEHEYLYSALPIHAGLASGAGDIFTVEGPNEGHDSAIVGAGLNVQLTKSVLLYLDYDGQVGRDRYDSHAVTGGLRWSF